MREREGRRQSLLASSSQPLSLGAAQPCTSEPLQQPEPGERASCGKRGEEQGFPRDLDSRLGSPAPASRSAASGEQAGKAAASGSSVTYPPRGRRWPGRRRAEPGLGGPCWGGWRGAEQALDCSSRRLRRSAGVPSSPPSIEGPGPPGWGRGARGSS